VGEGAQSEEGLYEDRPGAARKPLRGGRTWRDVEATALHQVVRGNLATLLAECEEAGGLPRFVERDFRRYLACGIPALGFTRVVCRVCRRERLVAFSCKSRGVCPSCNARRAHDTAIHLVEEVLPVAPYRQWTLSFPMRLRFLLARDSALLSEVLGIFVRCLFSFQRKAARRLGVRAPAAGAVALVQRFGSSLQLTPHFHLLAPEGVFEELQALTQALGRIAAVLDGEHPARPRPRPGLGAHRAAGPSLRLEREADDELGSLAGPATRGGYASAVHLHDPLHQRESEPQTATAAIEGQVSL